MTDYTDPVDCTSTGMVLIPVEVIDAINAGLDREIAKHPEAANDRDFFYQQLVNHFAMTGQIPDFVLEKKEDK